MSTREDKIKKEIKKQEKDNTRYALPFIITPVKQKPLMKITNKTDRAIFLLHLSGLSYRNIQSLLNDPDKTFHYVREAIIRGYEIYPRLKAL